MSIHQLGRDATVYKVEGGKSRRCSDKWERLQIALSGSHSHSGLVSLTWAMQMAVCSFFLLYPPFYRILLFIPVP